jgi:fibrillarin-like rRNA methylase
MKTLLEIYNKYKVGDWPDKNSVHSYLPVYEEILSPCRHTAKNILEIGLMNGESLRMWTEYFDGNVYGMDCSETPVDGLADLRPIIADGKHNIVIGDAASASTIHKYFYGIKFDVVIEDASHNIEQQIQIYNSLIWYMNKGGIYIIEDIQDIDATRHLFENIDHEKEVTIIDRRNVKGRYDDILVIITDK